MANLHHTLWKTFKAGYAAGMDHDGDDNDFGDAAEVAFAKEHPGQHARLVEDWAKIDAILARA